MDQATWGVLIASAIGMVGVVIAAVLTPWLTARRGERARLRDERRRVYADATRVMLGVAGVLEPDRLESLGQVALGIQAEINLLGSPRACESYNRFAEAMRAALTVIEIEGTKVKPVKSSERILGLAFPTEMRVDVRNELQVFLVAARADLNVKGV